MTNGNKLQTILRLKKNREIEANFQVRFLPTIKEFNEIEKWLITENEETGKGFYSTDWDDIKSLFEQNQMAIILFNKQSIGFVAWRSFTGKTACIEYAEIKPNQRRKGALKKLIDELLNFFRKQNICVVDLYCSPPESEIVWKCLGFVEFPQGYDIFNSRRFKHLFLRNSEYLKANTNLNTYEIIELWDYDYFLSDEDLIPPKQAWDIEFISGTRKLKKPIIHPAYYRWRLRRKNKNMVLFDNRIEHFEYEIEFGDFLIIQELPPVNHQTIT